MERVARFEPIPQELTSLRLRRRRVDSQPLVGKAGGPLEAPVGVGPGDSLAQAGAAKVLEQSPAHHLADLVLVVGYQVAGDAPHHLGDPLLPLLIPVGHLYLTAGRLTTAAARLVPVTATVRFCRKAWKLSAIRRCRLTKLSTSSNSSSTGD